MRRPTPETDAERREGLIRGNAIPTHVVAAEFAEELERQRDEAMAVANDLASAASHCLGWHDCRLNIGEKIAATLQRWAKLKEAMK
jgi:hypothetical protein